jgi:hypothetical protein
LNRSFFRKYLIIIVFDKPMRVRQFVRQIFVQLFQLPLSVHRPPIFTEHDIPRLFCYLNFFFRHRPSTTATSIASWPQLFHSCFLAGNITISVRNVIEDLVPIHACATSASFRSRVIPETLSLGRRATFFRDARQHWISPADISFRVRVYWLSVYFDFSRLVILGHHFLGVNPGHAPPFNEFRMSERKFVDATAEQKCVFKSALSHYVQGRNPVFLI